MIEYDARTAQYRGANGRFVPRDAVLQLVEQEISRNEIRLAAHTRLLAVGKIDLPEWETRMAQTLRDSHLRMLALGAGGQKQLTQSHYGAVGYQLKKQFEYLDGFAQDLHQGNLSEKQAINRAKLYGNSIKTTFHRSEQITRGEKFLGKRLLDSQAKHCAECLAYYQPNWTPISKLVSPGMNCSCGARCKCRIVYKEQLPS